MRLAGATRPLPGESANGDCWLSWRVGDATRVAVIDGLGHGPMAAEASTMLSRLFAEDTTSPIEQLAEAASGPMRMTRGAVFAVVEILHDKLLFAGVGNVDCRIRQSAREHRLMGVRGFVGGPTRTGRVQMLDLSPGWELLMTSDGITSRFAFPDLFAATDLTVLASEFLLAHARPTDDATVVLISDDDR